MKTKTYAQYLRQQRPSKHEVPAPRKQQHDDPETVRRAIERVKGEVGSLGTSRRQFMGNGSNDRTRTRLD